MDWDRTGRVLLSVGIRTSRRTSSVVHYGRPFPKRTPDRVRASCPPLDGVPFCGDRGVAVAMVQRRLLFVHDGGTWSKLRGPIRDLTGS